MTLTALLKGSPPPAPKVRGRSGVRAIVVAAPKDQKHTLDWWIEYLRTHWEAG